MKYIKKQTFLIFLVIVFAQNSYSRLFITSANHLTYNKVKKTTNDTVIFTRSNVSGVKVLNFDDNNMINFSEKKLKMTVKEENDDKYMLFIELNNKIIMTKKHIASISKVWINQNYLAFSIFTYSDEDGNNEGQGYVIDLANGDIVTLPKKLKNTCNPIVSNSCIYFVNELSLIKTDMKCNILNTIYLAYINRIKPNYNYLDNYNICKISISKAKLIIFFSPNKSKIQCQSYCGNINDLSKIIVMKN